MTEPLRWHEVSELPAGTRFVRHEDGLLDRRTYDVHVPGTGTVGEVTAWGRANPRYRSSRGREYSGGSHIEWSWEAACGHLSSRDPERRFYQTRRLAAQLLVAEVARHNCNEKEA